MVKRAVKVEESLFVKPAEHGMVPWEKVRGKPEKKTRRIPVNVGIPYCRFTVCTCKGNMTQEVLETRRMVHEMYVDVNGKTVQRSLYNPKFLTPEKRIRQQMVADQLTMDMLHPEISDVFESEEASAKCL